MDRGSAAAAGIAKQLAGASETELEQLYSQRNQILDSVQKQVLQIEGFTTGEGSGEFGTGWEGDDGEIYFNPEDVPARCQDCWQGRNCQS